MIRRNNPGESYELLVEWERKVFDKQAPEYLEYNEVIRGQPFEISFSITNIGKTRFPGGHIKEFGFTPRSGWTTTFTLFSEKKLIPEIPTGETITKNLQFLLDEDGYALMEFRIIPKEEGKILYYRSREGPPMEDSFHGTGLFSVNREQFEIIKLLRGLQSYTGRRDNDAIK